MVGILIMNTRLIDLYIGTHKYVRKCIMMFTFGRFGSLEIEPIIVYKIVSI